MKNDISEKNYSTINEILERENFTLNTILTSGRLVLDQNHKEAISYIMGNGRENQRVMFDLLTRLSTEEKIHGKEIINNYREGTSMKILVISLFFFINFITVITIAIHSFFLAEKIENK